MKIFLYLLGENFDPSPTPGMSGKVELVTVFGGFRVRTHLWKNRGGGKAFGAKGSQFSPFSRQEKLDGAKAPCPRPQQMNFIKFPASRSQKGKTSSEGINRNRGRMELFQY